MTETPMVGETRASRDSPGVLISNGRDVVRSDAAGEWILPAGDHETLFVIRPSGWEVPRSEHGLPQFYYLHREHGSPPLTYPGIEPTGPLPQRIDFPLCRADDASSSGATRVLLVADPQPHSAVHVDWYRQRIIGDLRERGGFGFGLVLGDVVRNDLSLFEPYVRANADIPVPMYHVIGNHDINFDAPDERSSTETYQRYFGPPSYGFFHDDTFFLVLNNVRFLLDDVAGREYRGGFSDDTLAFARNVLAGVPHDLRVVVATHIPLFPEDGDLEPAAAQERAALFEALSDHREVLAVSGHTHMQRHFLIDDPAVWPGRGTLHQWVVGAASGAWWSGFPDAHGLPDSMMRDGTPPGYGILTLAGPAYLMDFHVAGDPNDPQLRIHGPRHMVTHERDVPLYVNVFNGTPRTRVQFRVLPDDEWLTMEHTPTVDPHYMARTVLRDLSDTLLPGTRLPPAAISHHVWYSRIPRTLVPGAHELEVRVMDMWGREWKARHTIQAHAPEWPYSRIMPEHIERYRH